MSKPTKPSKSVTPRNPWVQAFRSGTHTDSNGVIHTYTEADIDTMAARVNAQAAGGFIPPVVTGHPETDSPRKGGVFEAYASGAAPRYLYVRVDELEPAFADSVQRGEYKYCSVALYPDLGLRHLGILGAANPAVKGMAPLEFGEGMFAEADAGKKPEDIIQFEEPWEQMSAIGSALMRISWKIASIGSVFSNLRDQLIATGGSVDDADKVYPSYLLESLTGFDLSDIASSLTDNAPSAYSETHKPGDTSPAPSPSAPPADAGGGAGGDTALAAENAELKRQLNESAEKASRKAFSERLDALMNDPAGCRLTPVQRAPLEKLYDKLHKAGEAQYAEGEPAFAELDALLAALPVQVQFSETHRTIPSTKSPVVADAERLQKEAR